MKPYLENVWSASAVRAHEMGAAGLAGVRRARVALLRRPSLWLFLFGLVMAPLSPWHTPLEALPALEVAAPLLFAPDPAPEPVMRVVPFRLAAILRPSPEPLLEGIPVTVTAYTSDVKWTDDEPLVTATGRWAQRGMIALSRDLLRTYTPGAPFDYGDRVLVSGLGEFLVEDTLNRRWTRRVDIWVPSADEARQHGRRQAQLFAIPAPEAIQGIPILASLATPPPPWVDRDSPVLRVP
jgi:3D (Asp-Asp-Asp) domain-containing protein